MSLVWTLKLAFSFGALEFISKPDWSKKNESQQSSIFKLPSVARDKSKSEAQIVMDGKVVECGGRLKLECEGWLKVECGGRLKVECGGRLKVKCGGRLKV